MKKFYVVFVVLVSTIINILLAVEQPTKYPSQYIDNWTYDEANQSQKVIISSTSESVKAEIITSTIVAQINNSMFKAGQLIGNTSFQIYNSSIEVNNMPSDYYKGQNITVSISSGSISVYTSTYSTVGYLENGYDLMYIQGDLTSPSTIYYYGYVTSWSLDCHNSTASFKTSFSNSTKILYDGMTIGDNFIVPIKSSYTYIYIDIPSGCSVGYCIGGFNK